MSTTVSPYTGPQLRNGSLGAQSGLSSSSTGPAGTKALVTSFLQVFTALAEAQPAILHCQNRGVALIHSQGQWRDLDISYVQEWWASAQADGLPRVFSPPGIAGGWCVAHPVCIREEEQYYFLLRHADADKLSELAPFLAATSGVLRDLLTAREATPEPGTFQTPPPASAAAAPTAGPPAQELLNVMLSQILKTGASDLHLKAGAQPVIRLHGELQRLSEFPVLTDATLSTLFRTMVNQRQQKIFEDSWELDFAYSLEEGARFRVNAARQRGTLSLAFRAIPSSPPAWTSLSIPEVCKDLVRRRSGLVLVAGPTGSGKSTTLAALIDFVNQTRSARIVTIEDPIEFLHQDQKSHVIQRQVGEDTASFAEGLRRALRQDPDLILIGEMRDLETISVALTAAETGHLVLATVHAQSAGQTIERITDVFPSAQQPQVRLQLSSVLLGTINQRLLPRTDKLGRVAAFEIMVVIPAIRNLIRESKLHELPSYISTNSKVGMKTLEQSLAELARKGLVDMEEAREMANDRNQLNSLLSPGEGGIKQRV